MAGEPQKPAKTSENGPLVGGLCTLAELAGWLAGLSDGELSAVAGAVRGEQNRRQAARVDLEARRARTAKARAASLTLPADRQRAKTAAATKARRAKRDTP